MRAHAEITITTFADTLTGSTSTVFESSIAGVNTSMELWMSSTGRFALYNQEAYYDLVLQARRRSSNMFHPDPPRERLLFIGSVWGAPTYDPKAVVILGRATLNLQNVPIDEI